MLSEQSKNRCLIETKRGPSLTRESYIHQELLARTLISETQRIKE
jgi:hypothetical protein